MTARKPAARTTDTRSPFDRVEFIAVGVLSAGHIGRLMRYIAWDAQKEVASVVTGELRQISHNQAETTIHFGVGAEAEFTFDPSVVITLDPAEDYSDVPHLIKHNEKAGNA